jgi:hypothetical protein
MKKYFSEHDNKNCFPLDYFKKGDVVFEAKIIRGSDFMFCNVVKEVGEKWNCDITCSSYKPRNGKSGICKHNYPVYEKTNKKIIVK